jgi:hypothetical protein
MTRCLARLMMFAVVSILLTRSAAAAQPSSMTAHFINIGQGESVLLEFPCGAMLVDAGATTVTKAVYATGWDGTVRVVVKGKDDITGYREH